MKLTQRLFALEIHDVSLSEPSRVLPIVDQMERLGYNALVLHQNDLMDCCTQLGLTANYGVSDLRLKKVRNNAAWLTQLVARLARFDARLFLEIKEPSFHDYAVELFPDLVGSDGNPDPFHPAWFTFCRSKVTDLLERVPGLGGLIVTLSSPESRVSLPDHLVGTQGVADLSAWFDRMIDAFQAPLAESGKTLFIRDFSYTSDMQSDVMAAVERRGGAVGASAKITAHDYFPEFPENPAAEMVTGPLIFEFEAFGEHMGWGVIPNCRVAEFRERMIGYRDRGAVGFLMRISWEAISGSNALDALSAVNVYALPKLAERDRDSEELILEWLDSSWGITGQTAHEVAELLLQSWEIPAAAYWEGKVFPRHSCLPSTWQEGWLSMATSGMGRRDRDLAIDPMDPALSEAARRQLFTRKDNAVALASRLAQQAADLAPCLPGGLAQQFRTFEALPLFARQFALAIKATFCAARAKEDDLARLPDLRVELLELASELEHRFRNAPEMQHHHRLLLDPAQVRMFAASLPVP